MLSIVLCPVSFMLSVLFAECRVFNAMFSVVILGVVLYCYAKCHYVECCYGKCRYALCRYVECDVARKKFLLKHICNQSYKNFCSVFTLRFNKLERLT